MTKLEALAERLAHDVIKAHFNPMEPESPANVAARIIRDFVDSEVRFSGGKDAAHAVMAALDEQAEP